MSYNKFLFDLDGVLVDTCEIQVNATREAIMQIAGVHVDDTILDSTIVTLEKLKYFKEKGLIEEEDIQHIYKLKKTLADKMFEELPLDKEKVKIFKYLKEQGYNVAVVTNGNQKSAEFFMKSMQLYEHIDLLLTSANYKNTKPHSEPYIRAMCHFGGKLEDYIIFEDSEVGLQAARGTGAAIHHVKHVKDLTLDLVKSLLC